MFKHNFVVYNIVLHPKMHIRHLNISHPKILVVIWMSTFPYSINQGVYHDVLLQIFAIMPS